LDLPRGRDDGSARGSSEKAINRIADCRLKIVDLVAGAVFVGTAGDDTWRCQRRLTEQAKKQILRLGFPAPENARGSPPSLRMTSP